MITSSLSPISETSVTRSSSPHGESRLLTRVHNCVSPRSTVLAAAISPARAASLSLAGIASSRLPSSTSTVGAMSGSLATTLAFCGGKKWIIRLGRNGISRSGSGAPTASGRKKSLGLRTSDEGRSCRHRARTERRELADALADDLQCHGATGHPARFDRTPCQPSDRTARNGTAMLATPDVEQSSHQPHDKCGGCVSDRWCRSLSMRRGGMTVAARARR